MKKVPYQNNYDQFNALCMMSILPSTMDRILSEDSIEDNPRLLSLNTMMFSSVGSAQSLGNDRAPTMNYLICMHVVMDVPISQTCSSTKQFVDFHVL